MVNKTALLLGASGLTGSHLLTLLLDNPIYQKVIVYVRSPLEIIHPKLEQKIIDYPSLDTAVTAEDVFCCLGTTIKNAGSADAFREVDETYPLKVAALQRAAGSQQFLVISAMGANAQSRFFYNRVKGTMEEKLQAIGFPVLHILRPSLLTGNRKEKRTLEGVVIGLFSKLQWLFIGPFTKYRSIPAATVARAMFQIAQSNDNGIHFWDSAALQSFC